MKQLLTAQQLVDHMSNKGITFKYTSKEDAVIFLSNNNYYMKFASYRANYKKFTDKSGIEKYVNLDFDYLCDLSRIDMTLRYKVFQMSLDIEHYLKVRLLNDIESNPNEDGYNIVNLFVNSPGNENVLAKILQHRSSDYCKDLINKYYPDFPVWVFVELISFGDLNHLCDFYNATYNAHVGNKILLNAVKDLRNASAHSNCLINRLVPGNNKPHHSVVSRVKAISAIGENSRDKKLKNKFIYDFTCMIFAYNELVTSEQTKHIRSKELHELFDERMLKNKDWYSTNNLITSSYHFLKIILDNILPVR